MLGGDTFDAPQGMVGQYTGLNVHVKVWNTGKTQAISQWELTIETSGGVKTTIQPIRFPETSNITDFYMSTIPIYNTPVYGDLMFLVPLPESVIVDKNTTWELELIPMIGRTVKDIRLVGDWPMRILR